MSVITLTTDFGTGSPYVAAMKGVILSLSPAVTIVDITHDVPPQDVRFGAVVLDDVAERFPAGTIHVVVIDPGVGTDRALVFARIGQQNYLAPDNGLLSRLARRTPPRQVIAIEDPEYWLSPVSATFHGRDILAPVAAWVSMGISPAQLGKRLGSLILLDWPEAKVSPGRIDGEVLLLDRFGNVLTNIAREHLVAIPARARPRVVCQQMEVEGICRTYGDRLPGTLLALVASSDRLELAVVGGSAAARFEAEIGDPVTVQWEET